MRDLKDDDGRVWMTAAQAERTERAVGPEGLRRLRDAFAFADYAVSHDRDITPDRIRVQCVKFPNGPRWHLCLDGRFDDGSKGIGKSGFSFDGIVGALEAITLVLTR